MQSFKRTIATRALAWVLAFVMVFTMIPYGAFAAGEAGEDKLGLAPAKVPTSVRDAAPPIESPVDNDSRNAVHAFVGVQTAGNLNDPIPDMTGQQFIPIAGIKAYFQWFEDGGYVSPIYTATSDANGRLNIGCKPYLAPDGKLIKFDADPTVSAGHEKYRFWVEEESIPEGYQLQYITGENVIFPKGIATITQGGSGSNTAKNTHENWKILLMQKPKAEMHRTDAKETPVKSKTGGNLDGKVSWDYNSPSGGIEWSTVAHHTEPAEGVTVRASYLSDYAMKQIFSSDSAVRFGVSSADEIRGSKWTPKLEKDLQDWIKEEVAKDPEKWIAETVTAKTNAEGKYIIQFNGTWGTALNRDVATDKERVAGGRYDGALHKWTEEEASRVGTVANSADEGTFYRGLVNYWERKHVNYDFLFVSTDGTDGIRVMTPYNNNYYTVMHEKYGISSGWSGTGTGVGVTNAADNTLRADFIFGPGEIDFHITNYDNDANTAFPGDIAQTSTTGLPHSFTSSKYQIVWYGPDGKEVKRGTAQQPSSTGTIDSEPFDTTGVTKTTEYTAKLHRVDSKGNLQDPIAIDSFTVEVSNYVGSRYDVFEHKNENPIKDAEYTAENLPEGLTIDAANGNISGKPKTAGLYDVKVTASMDDLDGQNVVGKITGSRTHKYLITDSPLADGTKGTEYNQKVVPTPQKGYVFKNVSAKFIAGKEIAGLTITKDQITGTPTAEVKATEDDPNVEVTYDIYKVNDKGQEVLIKKGHVDKVPLSIKDGEATIADKVKELGGINPQTIKVWKGDKIDWKNGVTPKNTKNEKAVWDLIEKAEVADITTPTRNSSNAGKFEGKLKFTFNDGSSIEVPNQMLIVSEPIVTIDPKDPSVADLPNDKIEVKFIKSTGIKEIINTGKTYVKPGTVFKDTDFPQVTVDTENGYAEPVKWTPEGEKVTTLSKFYDKKRGFFTFRASATLPDIIDRTGDENKPTPDGYVRVTFTNGEGVNDIENNKVYDVKEGTALTADQYPTVTPKDGFENPVWSVEAGTPITKDTQLPITATATATTPAEKDADKYTPSYVDKDGKAGVEVTTDAPTFKDADGKTTTAPDGTKYTLGKDAPEGATINENTGEVTYTPKESDAGNPVEIPVVVTYPDKSTDDATATINVEALPDVIDRTGNEDKPTPAGYVRVTFTNGDGVNDIEHNKVYDVKEGTALTADKYPTVTPKEGYETPVWSVAAGTPITKDTQVPITATATAATPAEQTATPKITAPKAGDKTITGTSEPNAKVVVELPDGTKVETTADNDGKWTANVPAGKEPKENDVVKAVATVDGKTPSEEATAKTTAATPAEQTATPNITAPKAGDKTITGTSEPNAKVVVELPDGTKVETTADGTGKWTANVPAGKEPKENDVVKAVATVDGKTPSEEATAKTTAATPAEQTAKPNITAPKAGDKTISGTSEPNASVEVTLPDGKKVTTTADNDGKWTANVPAGSELKEGEVVKAVATVDGKTPSEEATATVTGENPGQSEKPSINEPTEGDNTITGTGTPGAEVVVTDKDGKEIGKTTVGTDGKWSVPVPADRPLKKGETITATQTEDGKQPASAEATVKGKDNGNGGYWIIPWNPTTPSEEAPKHETAIHKLYIYGYEDSTFRPEGNMTRAEAAAMIARLQGLDLSNKAKPDFMDVRSGWYNAAINAVVNAGYMKGYPDGTFRPDGKITRAEFAQMIKAIDKANSATAPFADVKGHWAEAAINQAYANDRIAGYPDGTFRPNDQITRAEAVTIFNKLYDRHVEEPGIADVKSRLVEFNDINRGHWAYFQVVEASNTHEFYRTEKGKVDETWVRILQNWKEALANR